MGLIMSFMKSLVVLTTTVSFCISLKNKNLSLVSSRLGLLSFSFASE